MNSHGQSANIPLVAADISPRISSRKRVSAGSHRRLRNRFAAAAKWFASIALALFAGFSVQAQNFQAEIQAALNKTPHPTSPQDFQALKHLPPFNQGNTMICWSCATSSFLESEMARLKMEPIRLSVTYPLYCAFLEKTKRFVQTKGESRFAAGDLFHGVLDIYPQYGAIPAEVYGSQEGKIFDHKALYHELDALVTRAKAQKNWNEKHLLNDVQKILDRHLGAPPKAFMWHGKAWTPKTFLEENIRLPWSDYVLVTSFQYAPFNTFIELKVPDNWQHRSNYFNVPLDTFYTSLKHAVEAGYSVAMDIDNTEPSYKLSHRYGIVPDCDIPAANIDQTARELRFDSGATTDDHLIQVIGYKNFSGEDWFLVKDTAPSIWKGGSAGYIFLHSGYVKLKGLAFLAHKNALGAMGKLSLGNTP